MPSDDHDAQPRRPPRRLLLLGAVLLLVALAGCGAPEPTPEVCYGCSDDGAGRALPPAATTGESVTHLYLDPETGDDPRVVARTRVGLETAEELRTNESRREAVRTAVLRLRERGTPDPAVDSTTPTPSYEGTDGLPVYPVPAFEARDLSVRAESDSLVVGFRVAGIPGLDPDGTPPLAGEGYGDAVLVDRFDVEDGRNPHPQNEGHGYRLATDQLVVHAPAGTTPVVAPENATVYEDRVVLQSLPADTNLVFAPEGATGTLAAHATLTADRLDWVVPDSFWVALLPMLQLGLLLGGLRASEARGTRYALGAVLLALLLTLGPLVILLGPFGMAAAVLAVVVAAVLLWRVGGSDSADDGAGDADEQGGHDDDRRLPSLDRLRAGIEPWVGPVAVVAGVASVLTVAAAAAGGGPVGGLLFFGGGVLPVAALVGLGRVQAADTTWPRRERLLVLGVLVAPWLFAVGYVAGRGFPDSIEAFVLVLVWGAGVTLVGFVAHRIAR
jgi:hypothetical protein